MVESSQRSSAANFRLAFWESDSFFRRVFYKKIGGVHSKIFERIFKIHNDGRNSPPSEFRPMESEDFNKTAKISARTSFPANAGFKN
ncbi:hypothetical protein COS78_00715 [Candidatus Shapirobacteria bacterium CG06_land_8_20_14_3_00_40_12]|uniref:Uncharacterized protein n=1 Tax=Candidatus Shapirobacteria bacterium CG06_land_8_20_14_3_00_40_12 TaxID=1974881 RepID=A0A2M7ASY2_9BACT|nr:MAG: hypothetical protein COS78_00715 [Candidatus Shapirobacteria bacterium CG06_land_8_20_14_3_00_40_12]